MRQKMIQKRPLGVILVEKSLLLRSADKSHVGKALVN